MKEATPIVARLDESFTWERGHTAAAIASARAILNDYYGNPVDA